MLKTVFDKRYPVTSGILLITWLVFLAMQILRFSQATSAQAVYDFGGMLGVAIRQNPGNLWRLVTAIFVHIGWEHVFLNSLSIYFLGHQLELLFGSLKFALFYLLSGIMGNVFVLFLTPTVVAAGASTAIFGLLASMAVLRYVARNPYLRMLGQNYLMLLAMNVLLGWMSSGISHAGHLGGAVGGALCAIFLRIKGEETIFESHKRHLAWITYLLLVIGMVSYRLAF
ncbi:rhomboid family intramembrane serine protease [Streptococcus ovuberis]|uniref:Rhomboid family intramembrane serine protease n=1 Tax=Streptococcus ovuberis TaxID=1936207 RepID=A0A7X6MWE3_9STRE|nr:rhomboid family intramembrane serine protease [Streptococcus ovuberis]NKZ19617.1 rhomboid family intramembrane serine protease [Streptococcus ovuberis]